MLIYNINCYKPNKVIDTDQVIDEEVCNKIVILKIRFCLSNNTRVVTYG